MEPITLYAYKFRSRAERVLWTLKELHLPHTVVRLDPLIGETLTPEFLALNPSAKVPVLTQGKHIFTESLAIMEYLNDISLTIKLMPTPPLELYQCRHMMYYSVTEIEAYLWIVDQATRLSKKYPWPDNTANTGIERVKKAFTRVFDALNKQEYVAGNEFTLADIYYYQIITWAKKYDVVMPERVERYLTTLAARPHFPDEMK